MVMVQFNSFVTLWLNIWLWHGDNNGNCPLTCFPSSCKKTLDGFLSFIYKSIWNNAFQYKGISFCRLHKKLTFIDHHWFFFLINLLESVMIFCQKSDGLYPTYFTFLVSSQLTTSIHWTCYCTVHDFVIIHYYVFFDRKHICASFLLFVYVYMYCRCQLQLSR
jgi:hypothetical protein